MMRYKKMLVYGAVALAIILAGSWTFKRVQPVYGRYRLNRMIDRLEPWSASTNYSEAGWQQLIAAARTLQNLKPALARTVLGDYLQRYDGDPAQLAVAQGKVLLLLRVAFDFPENLPGAQRVPFGNWTRDHSDLNADGTINVAWPVLWNQGQPRLVAGCQGTAGSDYSVQKEFDYLRYRFKYRRLPSR
jgi:hypothetical protein